MPAYPHSKYFPTIFYSFCSCPYRFLSITYINFDIVSLNTLKMFSHNRGIS